MIDTKLTNSGLVFIENFITDEEALSLIDNINQYKKDNSKRITNHGPTNFISIYFGKRYLKKESTEIPEFLSEISNRLVQKDILDTIPLGIAINEYKKGQKISAHIDRIESGEIVTILSLNSEATMVFVNTKNKERFELLLSKNSLVQMKNEIRYDWTHEILPVPNLRYSIMFR